MEFKCDCNSCRVRNRLTDRRKQRERASSDPSPELRERLIWAIRQGRRIYAEALDANFSAYEEADTEILDAVLAVLGEK